jgi:hypothetical protein
MRPGPPGSSPRCCPGCSSSDPGSGRFCEECGASLNPASPGSALGSDPSSAPAATDAPVTSSGTVWEVVATADRAYFDRVQAESVDFPLVAADRHFQLTDRRAIIGRSSPSRGINPEVDLSASPTDTGISHQHAILLRQSNGIWAIVDPGSTNGVYINDSNDPLPVDRAIPLADGDRIHLGAWTTLSIRPSAFNPPGRPLPPV